MHKEIIFTFIFILMNFGAIFIADCGYRLSINICNVNSNIVKAWHFIGCLIFVTGGIGIITWTLTWIITKMFNIKSNLIFLVILSSISSCITIPFMFHIIGVN